MFSYVIPCFLFAFIISPNLRSHLKHFLFGVFTVAFYFHVKYHYEQFVTININLPTNAECKSNPFYAKNLCDEVKKRTLSDPFSVPWIGFISQSITDILLGFSASFDRFISHHFYTFLCFILLLVVILSFLSFIFLCSSYLNKQHIHFVPQMVPQMVPQALPQTLPQTSPKPKISLEKAKTVKGKILKKTTPSSSVSN
jgi:hypothetical protein